MASELNRFAIEGAKILFRNFSGKEGKYNAAGRRNFCVLLSDEDAKILEEDGWAVRYLVPRDDSEDETPQPYLQVALNFDKGRPPTVLLISSGGKTRLDGETVQLLDWADIRNVDLVLRPYRWEINDKSGTKAYLKALYVTIEEDEFEHKYRDAPDSALSSLIDIEEED